MTELPRTSPAVVIGGGIAGCADAFFLSKSGISTVLIEAQYQLGTLTTAQAVACFRAQWDIAEFGQLVLPSIDFYEQFPERTGLDEWDIGLRENGWLFVTGEEDGARRLQDFVVGHRALGVVDSEYLDGSAARSRFSWLGKSVVAASYRRRDGWLSPNEAAYGFAKASGATVCLRTTAIEIRTSEDRVVGVATDRGFISTDTVVVAAGPFSKPIAQTAGVELPVTTVRRHRALVIDGAIPHDAPMVLDFDTHVYWRPEGDGAFLGFPEPEEESAPSFSVPTQWEFPAVAMQAAARLVPFWAEVALRASTSRVNLGAGQYTCTLDGLPILGRSPVAGLYLHTADNGWGIESAPEAACVVARAVVDAAFKHPWSLARRTINEPRQRSATY